MSGTSGGDGPAGHPGRPGAVRALGWRRGRWIAGVRRVAGYALYVLALAPWSAAALDLGAIELHSALYEPLDARVPVRGMRNGELKELEVTLGSPSRFEAAGVARLPHLDLIEFVAVEQGGAGYIHVRTDEPIIEPSLAFVMEVRWPGGHTVRSYTLRFVPAAGRMSSGVRQAPRAEPERSRQTGATGAPPASNAARHGPVQPSETLWLIAVRLRPDSSVSVQRMMLAILEANPEAFAIRNINALEAGAILRIPTRDEIGPDDTAAAIAEVQRQNSAWAAYREGAGAAPATPTPAPPAPPAPAPAPRDAAPAPDDRLEIVASERPPRPVEQEEGAEIEALRRELAFALEEADASLRERDELGLRLTEAEERIGELSRLVDLKDEEIAALQSDLRELRVTMQGAAPAEVESEQPPGAPAAGPLLLFGGAGLLLILLGGAILLIRRRRARAGEEDAVEAAAPAPSEEHGLILELENVAEELASPPGTAAGIPERALEADSDAPDFGPDGDLAREGAARSRRDDRSVENALLGTLDTADNMLDFDFDVETPAGRDLAPGRAQRVERAEDDEFDTDDFGEVTGEAAENIDHIAGRRRTRATGEGAPAFTPATDAGDLPDPDSGIFDEVWGDSGSSRAERTEDGELDTDDARDLPELDSEVLDDVWDASLDESLDRRIGGMYPDADTTVEDMDRSAAEDVDGSSAATTGTGVDAEPDPDAAFDESGAIPQATPGRFRFDDDAESLSFGGSEGVAAQTKLDFARTCIEMGDAETGRRVLEEVLVAGDAEQQATAREMLSKIA